MEMLMRDVFDVCMHAGRFLKMFLGPINVRASRKDVQFKVKEEYNSYRVCFIVF